MTIIQTDELSGGKTTLTEFDFECLGWNDREQYLVEKLRLGGEISFNGYHFKAN
jgi:hypothetical protein